jgi:predicted Zn-ribbon and HTH transcriptional regulator
MLNHHQAAVIMNVSRPTLTRIYEQARQKIARALVTGSQIIIEGGKIYFDSEWYRCHTCGCYFNNPEKQNEIGECPLCKSSDISNYQQVSESEEDYPSRCSDFCVCIACGFEQPHHFGRRCRDEICPACGGEMTRKANYRSNYI